jgi:phosphoesterase RecJ-like protein
VVVTAHIRPDGDSIGAVLALWHGLRSVGVEAYAFLEDPPPPMFAFLPGAGGTLDDADRLPGAFSLVVLDCGLLDRVGEHRGRLLGRGPTVNIDHHDANAMFADLNYVDPEASSCGEMLFPLLADGGVPFTADIAECLYTAIVTDTGQFSHGDTTPEALRISAECMQMGVDPEAVAYRLFYAESAERFRLRQMAMSTLELHGGGRIATLCVTEEMFRQTGLGPVDTEGFADLPIRIDGVRASALLKEMPGQDYIKVSMRSRDSVDVFAVAKVFDGGGHTNAAGCEIPDDLVGVRRRVADELLLQLKRQGQA